MQGAMMAKNKKARGALLDNALSSVLAGGTPDVGSDERFGTVKIVDPYEDQEWRDGKSERPGYRIKVVALRDDPLGRLYARGQIDEAKYQAGREWQELYHKAEIGNLKAIDTTRDVVDGGRMPEVLTDTQRDAMTQIARLDRALGLDGSALVRQILGERLFIRQVAERRGLAGREALEYLGRRFRECLETMAVKMHLA